MTGRRAIVGLCMLCALLVGAVAAQSASAKGETAFTCVKNAVGDRIGEHCLASGTGEKYSHVSFNTKTPTSIQGGNAKTASNTTASTNSILKVTIAGTPLELQATGVTGTGTMENVENEAKEMSASGTGTITYTGVTVKKPEGKGCKVFADNAGVEGTEGTVTTNKLKATTVGEEGVLKFEPNTGSAFATFFVTCNKGEVPETLEGTWEVTGSIKCPITGATTVCSHENTTTQNTLKAKGSKAGLEGAITIEGTDTSIPGDVFRPLVTTKN